MNALLRGSLASLVGSVALLTAPAAFAADEPCFNDTDCPGGGMVCGGDVCNWMKPGTGFPAEKPYTCNPAGSQTPKGHDGWCTSMNGADNCKCKAEGAKCVGTYCTFTKASDAPVGTAGAGTGGAAGTAGSGTGGSGTAGTAAKKEEDSGGCSVSVPGNTGTGVALALGVVGLGIAFARRRR